jgi:hypothetical protein
MRTHVEVFQSNLIQSKACTQYSKKSGFSLNFYRWKMWKSDSFLQKLSYLSVCLFQWYYRWSNVLLIVLKMKSKNDLLNHYQGNERKIDRSCLIGWLLDEKFSKSLVNIESTNLFICWRLWMICLFMNMKRW